MKNAFYQNKLLFTYFLIYIVLHLLTLSKSPLVWFDETYFASIANWYEKKGELYRVLAFHTLNPEHQHEQTYGFVYFWIAALVFKIFGFGLFQFRMIALVSGLILIGIGVKILALFDKSVWKQQFLAIGLSADQLIFRSMHEGRMDLTAACLGLAGIYFWLKILLITEKKLSNFLIIKNLLLFVLFLSLALLTTPRIGFYVVGLILFGIISLFQFPKDCFFYLQIGFISGLSIALIYMFVWIIPTFGTFENFIHYYWWLAQGFTKLNIAESTVPKVSYALIVLTGWSVLYFGFTKRKDYFSVLVQICLTMLVSFYTIVFDTGVYSVLVIPFFYFLLFLPLPSENHFLHPNDK